MASQNATFTSGNYGEALEHVETLVAGMETYNASYAQNKEVRASPLAVAAD